MDAKLNVKNNLDEKKLKLNQIKSEKEKDNNPTIGYLKRTIKKNKE